MDSATNQEFEVEFEEESQEAPMSCHELLFDFLYKIRQHHCQPEYEKVFTPEFDLDALLWSNNAYIGEEFAAFRDITEQGRTVHENATFVHDEDLLRGLGRSEKQLARRHLSKVPVDKRIPAYRCPIHDRACPVTSEAHAFVCVLHRARADVSADVEPFPEVALETEADVEVDIDPAQERLLSQQVNPQSVRDHEVHVHDEEEVVLDSSKEVVPVPVLPTFQFGEKEYVLLTDLQSVFNLREDYCLAIIAQNLEADKDFVDDTIEKYGFIDSSVRDTEYLNAAETLSMIYEDAKRYQETLPTEEEFNSIQIRLGIDRLGSDRTGGSVAVGTKGVDLWNKKG